ncbi:SURF1 family protein [Wenzhouxiangella sediminis]|uniref:SURF1-like protein n=1 Tax=Wenzhouxiangella sediminis TaxID=1792836 RepID=A0A3E1KBH9_9GAMM|nr:SURF1 family protein [Wenzhouxiangella sediminis]RFF31933.1 SURF1 family protein [Wenzhouxiangella sediminis]
MSRPSSFIIRSIPHLAAVLVILMCSRLAVWQFDRADEKRGLMQAWEQAGEIALGEPLPADATYAEVRATGTFEPSRNVLLDNQIRAGQAGVHVFTPFRPDGMERSWLVNRGWHPLASRQAPLPRVGVPETATSISGRLRSPPRVGRQLGEARPLDADNWPNLVTYLDLDRVEQALGSQLADRVILLDPAHPAHLTGDDWRPVNFGPDRHLAYAWQWITMAVAVFLIWVALTWRKIRKS